MNRREEQRFCPTESSLQYPTTMIAATKRCRKLACIEDAPQYLCSTHIPTLSFLVTAAKRQSV